MIKPWIVNPGLYVNRTRQLTALSRINGILNDGLKPRMRVVFKTNSLPAIFTGAVAAAGTIAAGTIWIAALLLRVLSGVAHDDCCFHDFCFFMLSLI